MVREGNPCQSAAAGSRAVKTEPLPGWVAAVTSPPIMGELARDGEAQRGAPEPLRGRGIGLGDSSNSFAS